MFAEAMSEAARAKTTAGQMALENSKPNSGTTTNGIRQDSASPTPHEIKADWRNVSVMIFSWLSGFLSFERTRERSDPQSLAERRLSVGKGRGDGINSGGLRVQQAHNQDRVELQRDRDC